MSQELRSYENMIILHPELSDEEREQFLEKVKSTVEKNQGVIEELKDWNRRKLAYPIQDYREGHYHIVYFSGNNHVLEELERFYRVSDEVLRFLFIRLEEAT